MAHRLSHRRIRTSSFGRSRWKWVPDASSQSAQTLMGELVILDNYVESINSGSRPRLATLRFSGLLEIEARYSRVSRQYRGAAKLLNSVLSAAVNATLTAEPDATLVYISIPVVQQSYGRRTPGSLLAPFKTSENSFSSSAQLQRRSQVFAGRAPPSAVPIISSSRTSYSSEDECDKATGSCNGHGKCVQGRKTTGGQGYVCSCSSTTDDNGKSTSWSGETCQKQDISRCAHPPACIMLKLTHRLVATLSCSPARPSVSSSSSPPASPSCTTLAPRSCRSSWRA